MSEPIDLAADASKLLAEVERLKESLDLACRKLQTYGSACAERDRRIAELTELLRESTDWVPSKLHDRINAVLEEPTT